MITGKIQKNDPDDEAGIFFVFYTDGLVEAKNQLGQTFDEKRLAVYVRNPKKMIAQIYSLLYISEVWI